VETLFPSSLHASYEMKPRTWYYHSIQVNVTLSHLRSKEFIVQQMSYCTLGRPQWWHLMSALQ